MFPRAALPTGDIQLSSLSQPSRSLRTFSCVQVHCSSRLPVDEPSAAATDLLQHQDLIDCDCRCLCSDCSSCVQIVWQVACTAVCVLSALQCGLPGLQTRAGGRHCSCCSRCRGYPACSASTPLHFPLCCSGGRPASVETAQLHCAPLQSHNTAVSSGPVLQAWPGPARSAEYRPAAG